MKSRKQCSRCGTSYCSKTCQKAHWQIHKRSCHFKVVVPSQATAETLSDALSLLCTISDPGTQTEQSEISSAGQRVFNIPELRMAVFSELPAIDLLRTQRVCRSWYLTSTLELKLQQRLFLSPGPGELVKASYACKCRGENCQAAFANAPTSATGEPHAAIHPYTQNLRDFLKKQQEWGGGRLYLLMTPDGTKKEVSAPEVQHMGVQIICNPFLTKFWPQNPTNMTLLPERFACDLPREQSWRRMQLTSPPVLCVGMNLWCVNVSFSRHVSGHSPSRLTH
jgi:hypothetical protein